MKKAIICLTIAFAAAAPAISGYGYGPGISGSSHRLQTVPIYRPQSNFIHQPQYHQQQYHQQQYHQQAAPIITKNFYIHSAPEETEQEIHQELNSFQPPRKHYNVVFIKAPVNSIRASTLSLAQALHEEKTVIYVLSKKPDIHEVHSALQDVRQAHQKPEVFFIKYKTPEEAQHAQHSIQAQYDALGGSSHISDEGISPITSVIGSLAGEETVSDIGQSVLIAGSTGVRGYLPPQKIK